ncbi:MAG: hypothetical protein ABFE02_15065 [Sulfuricella sp.]
MPELGRFEVVVRGPLARVLGSHRIERLGAIRNAFERDIPPSEAFLRWLLNNPGRLVWPSDAGGREKIFAASTTEKRKKLIDGDKKVRDEALSGLDRFGVCGSKWKWWAFEGFTSVDCLLETERLLVFIEGKRTEGISSATDWFPRRNQVIRNVEVAREMAGKSKEYAVLLCAEQHIDLPDKAWQESLPHCQDFEIEELKRHYLGCATWSEIVHRLCPDLMLPDTLDEAIDYCAKLRNQGHTS